MEPAFKQESGVNRSHAVVARRHEPADSRDDFPTPPWAARALMGMIRDLDMFPDSPPFKTLTCWEPCAGRGYMSSALSETFGTVVASDIHDYGVGFDVCDFMGESQHHDGDVDFIVTNPPFRLAEAVAIQAIRRARHGVALLVRTQWIHGIRRHGLFFKDKGPRQQRPAWILPFAERVPMVRGRLDPKASTATDYSWIVWNKGYAGDTRLDVIDPCRKRLEQPGDYPD